MLAFFEAHFGGEANSDREQLFEMVDESEFSLRDWVESLLIVGHWLDSHTLKMPLSDQLGYVSCSVDAVGSSGPYTELPVIVRQMLDAYGCERADEK